MIFASLCFADGAELQEAEARFAEATLQLEEGNWTSSVDAFEQLAAEGWHSATLYHNLAVAHQRLGEKERALVNLYRAWLLQPFSDAGERRFEEMAGELKLTSSLRERARGQLAAGAWRGPLWVAGLAMFWAGVFLCLLGFRRAVFRAVGIVGLVLGLLGGAGGVVCDRRAPQDGAAWVIDQDAVPLRASHGEGSPRVHSLSPLTPVTVEAVYHDWCFVRSENGQKGWLKGSQIARIQPWKQVIDEGARATDPRTG